MQPQNFLATCRCCSYYEPEGRRGGLCQQLGVPVKGCWKACSLAAHPFTSNWQVLEAEIVRLEHSLSLDYTTPVIGFGSLEGSGSEHHREPLSVG